MNEEISTVKSYGGVWLVLVRLEEQVYLFNVSCRLERYSLTEHKARFRVSKVK
jgi:hypothetical protein